MVLGYDKFDLYPQVEELSGAEQAELLNSLPFEERFEDAYETNLELDNPWAA